MKIHPIRFKSSEDLRGSIEKYASENKISAGFILSCVGSLSRVTLRMSGGTDLKTFKGKFEIVSLVGTLSVNDCHLHMSMSDKNGNVIGGHLKEGCIIHTTIEIIIGEAEDFIFNREMDENTGFEELTIKKQINH